MSSFSNDVARLEGALVDAVPASRDWIRNVDHIKESWEVALTSTVGDGRTLSIVLHGGDITVAFHVGPTGIGRGPYEAHGSMPDEQEPAALVSFATFVADLLNERLVLAMPYGWPGGREFLKSVELTPSLRRMLEWVASWKGTYDSAIPTA